jgi:hypothetical protein
MVISEERSVILYELKNAGWQLMQTIIMIEQAPFKK